MRQTGSARSRVLIAAAVVVAAGIGGFLAYRGAGTAPAPSAVTTPPVAEAKASPASVTEPQSKPPGRAIPDTLPDITLADKDGKPTRLAQFAGRPLMVNFWATWCAPCRREIPLLNRLRAERHKENAEIVGIAVDFHAKVLEFVEKVPIDYPLLIGEEDGLAAAEAFGLGMAFPFSVFVDSQNRILTVKMGELHEDEANFAFDRLRDIDEGKMTREQAQRAVSQAFREFAAQRARTEAASASSAS